MRTIRTCHPTIATALLCTAGLNPPASAQDQTIKVFAPNAQQLATSDAGPVATREYEPRTLQSGAYNQRADRNRPFYGQSWSEDWGSVQVAVSREPVFVPRNGGQAFEPDRRPAVEIVMHNGTRANPRGMANVWYAGGSEDTDAISGFNERDVPLRGSNGIPDAFDYLVSRLDMHYDNGFRRMILHLPAGAVDSTHMDSAQYWTMEDWRRKWFWIEVRRWIEEKKAAGDPVSMGVYLGWKIHDPTVFDMTGAVPPDMSNPTHVKWMHQNIYPWIRLGFNEFWFDASGSARAISETNSVRQRDVLASLRHSPTWGPVAKFGGEAVPGIGRLIDHRLDEVAIRGAGWMGIPLFLESRFSDYLSQSPDTPFFDPGTTEATCWMRNSNRTGANGEPGAWQDYPLAHYERLRQHGMVFRAQESRMGDNDYRSFVTTEFVQRLLGFGVITAPIDFDGDGFIEIERGVSFPYAGEDWDKFLEAAMTTIRGGGGSGYFAGDISGDGSLDMADIVLYRGFLDDYLNGMDQGEPVITPLDLGQPWWVPVSSGR